MFSFFIVENKYYRVIKCSSARVMFRPTLSYPTSEVRLDHTKSNWIIHQFFHIRWHKQGRSHTFHLGGALEGPVLQQGELSMFCVGLSERDLLRLQNDNFSGMTSRGKDWRGHCGDQANFWGCSSPPWYPPSSAPEHKYSCTLHFTL